MAIFKLHKVHCNALCMILGLEKNGNVKNVYTKER